MKKFTIPFIVLLFALVQMGISDEIQYFSYNTKDFKKSKEFYHDIFGFEITYDGGEEVGWCEFALPLKGARLGLSLQNEGEIVTSRACIVFTVEDLEKTQGYLKKNNVNVVRKKNLSRLIKTKGLGQKRITDYILN